MTEERHQPHSFLPGTGPERVLLGMSLLATLLLLAWVVNLSRHGYDYTDDAFYLIWAARPFDYAASSTQFGFAHHPLYLLVGGDIAAFRAMGFLTSFGLATVLAWTMLRRVFGADAAAPAAQLAIAAAFGTLGLLSAVFAGQWLPTPSYNSLALQGAMLAAAALCLIDGSESRGSPGAWILGGVALWVAFLGKPTTAAALGVFVAGYLLLTRQAHLPRLLLAGATAAALVLLTGLAIDGSVAGFIQRQSEGLQLGRLLGGGHTWMEMFRIERPPLGRELGLMAVVLGGGLLFAVQLTHWRPGRFPSGGPLAGTALALFTVGLALWAVPLDAVPNTRYPMLIFPLVFAMVFAGLAGRGSQPLQERTWKKMLLAPAMLSFAYAYAFGSSSSYWSALGSAWIFVALAGIVLLAPLRGRPRLDGTLLVTGFVVQALLAVVLGYAVASPYRQPQALWQQNVLQPVGNSALLLSRADADYLTPVREAARTHGFRPGTPVIDLSGRAPGLLYAMEARNAGLAWNLSGYPGTAAYVVAGLKGETCEELANAWVLSQTQGPVPPVPAAVLASFGADLERDYVRVARTVSPVRQVQWLHKPTRSAAEAARACDSVRGTQP